MTQGEGNGENVHTYYYSEETLNLDYELISYAGESFERKLYRHYDNLLRPNGYELKKEDSLGVSTETSISYAYDNAGRLNKVGASYPEPETPEFTYNYLAKSESLVESVMGPVHSVTNTYEDDRNLLIQKQNKDLSTSPITVSSYTYVVNALGQRTSQDTSGSAFTSDFIRNFGYDAIGQVVADNHSVSSAFDRVYGFDGIGNRVVAVEGNTAINYTANSRNQYVSVGGTSQVYDADGNLINDGSKKYFYDAENRLIEVQDAVTNNTLVVYEYDCLSRKITKVIEGQTNRYVYDGWNLIAEYKNTTGSLVLDQSYTWGLDLSGSVQAAGGAGGLLKVTSENLSFYPTYDGNWNVSEYLDSSGGVAAHYEYDTFGKSVVANGVKANDFTHRFSTKQWDDEAGLYYYGYRYYSPVTGRWINRDPLEEEWGGMNLYAFIGNVFTGSDILGLASCNTTGSKLFPYGSNALERWKPLKTFAQSGVAKFLGIVSLLYSVYNCIENVITTFFTDWPECFDTAEERGEWREKQRSSFRSLIQDCTGALFGAIGAATSGWFAGAAAWFGQMLGDFVARNLDDATIDDTLGLNPGPPLCSKSKECDPKCDPAPLVACATCM